MHDETVTVLIIEDEPQIWRLVRNALHADPAFLRLGLEETDSTLFGEPRVNVLLLNIAVDSAFPRKVQK